jgi:cytochrome c oxidase assembly factor CtaG
VHFVGLFSTLMMWFPVCGPIKELRLSLPGQMVYLFLMSVIPTVPAGFLTFAEGALYESYDHNVRLWGIDITTDQQMAGLIMKLVGGIYLWGWIGSRMVRYTKESQSSRELVLVETKPPEPEQTNADTTVLDADLTFEDVQAEFDRADPAPPERI